MPWWIPVVALGGFTLACGILNLITRAVGQKLDLAYALENCVVPWMLKGVDGTRAVLYHKGSNTLIQVVKSMVRRGGDWIPSLRVMASRAPSSKEYRPCRGWVLPLRRLPYTYRIVGVWQLPSLRAGQVLCEWPCQASLEQLRNTIQRVVDQYVPLTEDGRFFVWCVKGSGLRVWGKFEK